MNRVLHLIRGDWRQITRDPMLMLTLLAPVILFFFVRFVTPYAAELARVHLQLDLTVYYDSFLSFMILLIPLMLGMMSGFVMLDERDENVISYYAVTPLTKQGYFLYRLAVPLLMSILFTFFLLAYGGLAPIHITQIAILLPVTALEAPLLTLFLVGFAANKVEGLALSKAAGLIVFAPVLIYFLPMPWQLFVGILPSYWVSKTLLVGLEQGASASFIYAFIGLLVHLLVIRDLLRRFIAKLD
ncbi:hypothetical protein BVG16_24145 [Paenibacillus selenitireducens]|uniref:Uncharacterized protein n=1 Tax=Paenibacillus selenitireducens TaxID=1324314 RepID=A0A1T2X2X2_9BACL|nr:hypothetical protein [Paenibacillus selenitireducens]OPA74224.1 hypothetical protein BVG16_24145 [Paenibacillus selenitireducens]